MKNNSEFIGLTFAEIILTMFFLIIVLLPLTKEKCPPPCLCPDCPECCKPPNCSISKPCPPCPPPCLCPDCPECCRPPNCSITDAIPPDPTPCLCPGCPECCKPPNCCDCEKLRKKIKELEEELAFLKENQFYMEIKGDDKWIFRKGKKDISNFENILSSQIPSIQKKIDNLREKYGNNAIEVIVIGHTDFSSIIDPISNLDSFLTQVIKGEKVIYDLEFGSNADLALIRALNVALFLKNNLYNVKIKVYSAAQLINPDGQMITVESLDRYENSDAHSKKEYDAQKRRIEIYIKMMERSKNNEF